MAGTDAPTKSSLEREYTAITHRCGLLDRSDRGKLALTGPDAVEFLNGQVTNELVGLRPGEGTYAAFLTHKGKMLGDLRILAIGDDRSQPPRELLLDTERSALQALFDMIRRFQIGYDVELHKRTLERGLLSLIGPTAEELIDAPPPPREHAHTPARIASISALAVRTATGIDLLCEAADTQPLSEALGELGAPPVSEGAVEILRVERGEPRYGIDLDDTVIPQEAGLNDRAVSFAKGCYVGQETVARLHYKGRPNRHLRGLRLSEPVAPGAELRIGERTVGVLSSAVVSPTFGPIGLALVRREAQPGARLIAGDHQVPAEVVELPFAPTDPAIG